MAPKRKRGDDAPRTDVVFRPEPGTKSFATGRAVRDGLATGTRQALISFYQQILTPHSALPLPITHATVLILQHYLDVSPTADEVFAAWKLAAESDKLAETAAHLLAHILRVLTPLPFFRKQLVGIVNKLVSPTEPFPDMLARLLQSGSRDQVLAGLDLASAAVHVDKPDPANLMGSSRGRLAVKVWQCIVDGSVAKHLHRMLSMRRRNKDGSAIEYGDRDPLDRPDIRHLAIQLILPLLPVSEFHSHAKSILPALYSGLAADPPVTVYRVLTVMWAAISGPPLGVSRRISLVLLDEGALQNISRLLDRGAIEPTTDRPVGDVAQGFLESVTTNPERGICFPDEGWYKHEEDEDNKQKRGLHNRILSNVVRKLGARVIEDNGRVGSWVVKMFEASPELVAGYWPHSALALDPRLDARWIATMAYVGRVVSLPLPARSKFNQPAPRGTDASLMPPRTSPPAINIVVESVLPSPMTKAHLTKGLQHSSHLVQHITALALARGLKKLASVQDFFATIANELGENAEGPWRIGARELEIECRRRVPEVSVLIEFAQKSATMSRPPPDADDDFEVEASLVARSAMLTEAALRLFGLYHRTLPGLAGEAKFDVGRLLVSASSKNQERRARREAREGSVISDSGSVASSLGTVGTVGMGGGFGHSRGDVEGFEALSQLHVLRLLADVPSWNWTNKASGSQFTYLYHILQLHLSTRNKITQTMTTTLLHRLLEPSLLFEHDPLELPIWLDALPRASEEVSGPMYIAQQIHLLSFLDECVRRALKTPHRYIEESAAMVPEYAPQELASPLLVTMLEQLHAKLLGMHISTEAAAVVLNYLGRVVFSLLGKQANNKYVCQVHSRLQQTYEAAVAAGQRREGLKDVIEGLYSDIATATMGQNPAPSNPHKPMLVDENDWKRRSFERVCVHSFSPEAKASHTEKDLENLICLASGDERVRHVRMLLHFIECHNNKNFTSLLGGALKYAEDDAPGRRLKRTVFNNHKMHDLFLSKNSDDVRRDLVQCISALDSSSAFDRSLAEPIAHAATEKLADDTDLKVAFGVLGPWVPFLNPTQRDQCLHTAIRRLQADASRANFDFNSLLEYLVTGAQPESVYPLIPSLFELVAYHPLVKVLSAAASSMTRKIDVKITSQMLQSLVSERNPYSKELLELLLLLCPTASEAFTNMSKDYRSVCLEDESYLPALRALPTISDDPEMRKGAVTLAVKALLPKPSNAEPLSPHQSQLKYDAATAILANPPATAEETAVIIAQELLPLPMPRLKFHPRIAHAAALMAEAGNADLGAAIDHLLQVCLIWATSILSSEHGLEDEELEGIKSLQRLVDAAGKIRIDARDPEPAITAVITSRRDKPAALEFAASLVHNSMMKAGFVRQQLQVLSSSREISRLALASIDSEHRLAFVSLFHALFHGNTYLSCQPGFVEPLVPMYRGTLGPGDRLILEIFTTFETQRKLSLSSVLQHWSPTGGVSARTLDALTSLDPQRVFATCAAFPLRRANPAPPAVDDDDHGLPPDVKPEDVYDPVFVLALFSTTLESELGGLDWVEIMRSNVLGLAVCALTSRDEGMRRVAGYVLNRTIKLISTAQFHEQLMLLHTLELVAHALPADGEKQARLPPLIALFVAHALRAQAHPSNFLFPISSRFLLQRPTLDIGDVPMLYGMLYAAGDGARRERAWIVRLLRDGVRTDHDAAILGRRNTASLLFSLFQSSLDAPFRRGVLAALRSLARTPLGARTLLNGGMTSWIRVQWADAPNHPSAVETRDALLELLFAAVAAETPIAGEPRRPPWAREVADLVASLARDGRDLEALARIAYRLSAADPSTIPTTLPPLVALDPQPKMLAALVPWMGRHAAHALDDDAWKEAAYATELLFRTSLNITPDVAGDMPPSCISTLADCVTRIKGPIGEWARTQARKA